jgi:hypothetical protein
MLVDRRSHDDDDVIAGGQVLRRGFNLKAEREGACEALLETFVPERHFPALDSIDCSAVDVIEEYAMVRGKSYAQWQPDVTASTHDPDFFLHLEPFRSAAGAIYVSPRMGSITPTLGPITRY